MPDDDYKEVDLPPISGEALSLPADPSGPDSDDLPLPELANAVKAWLLRKEWLEPDLVDELFTAAQQTVGTTGGSVLPILRSRELLQSDQLQELEEVERLNDTLPRFVLEERLGAGAVGAVYLATDKETGTRVALKFLHEHVDGLEEHRERFEREAATLAQLSHPVIPRLIDHSRAMERGDMWIAGTIYEQPPYLAMEFVEGMTLKDLVKKADGPVPEAFALWAIAQLARALDHAFSKAGVIHRDIKPDNIIVQMDGDVPISRLYNETFPLRIIDFGLAKVSTRGETTGAYRRTGADSGPTEAIDTDQPPADEGELTMTGAVVGTPRYMAPEQIMGEPVSWEADMYSLGATLYHLLTGQPPYAGASPTEVMMAHLQSPIPDPREIVPAVSSRATRVVMRAMEKKKRARFPSNLDFAEACERALKAGHDGTGTHLLNKPYTTRPGTTSHHRRKALDAGSGGHPVGTTSGGHRISPSGAHPIGHGSSGTHPLVAGAQAEGPAATLNENPFDSLERSADASDSTIATDKLTKAVQERIRHSSSAANIPVSDLSEERQASEEATRVLLEASLEDGAAVDRRPWIFVMIAILVCLGALAYRFL